MSGHYPRPVRAGRWCWRPESCPRWLWRFLPSAIKFRIATLKGPKS